MRLTIGGHFTRASRHMAKALVQLAPTLAPLKDSVATCSHTTAQIEWLSVMLTDKPLGHYRVVPISADAFVVELGCGDADCSPNRAPHRLLEVLAQRLPQVIDDAPLQQEYKSALQAVVTTWWKEYRWSIDATGPRV